jgi:glycosyltransferase involved in cell wall biosynthesis
MTAPLDIWLLTNAPSPYQVELLAAVAGSRDVNLRVRYMRGDGVCSTPEGSSIHVMGGIGLRSWRDEVRLHPIALRECIFGHYDCYVLSGLWASVTFLTCALVLWLRRRPWVLWLERPHLLDDFEIDAYSKLRNLAPFRWMRDRIRKFLLRRCSAVLCTGTAARDAYALLGTPHEKLFVLPYCRDNQRFETVEPKRVAAVKRRHDLNGKIVLLFSGQMIARKGVDTLLKALERIARVRSNVALLLLGDGPERTHYESMVPSVFRSSVHFAGHLSQRELPEHFAAADLFVFPSRHDGWGVVINEACAAALPVVTTRQTGAAYDLVEDGRSGFILEHDDVDGFVDRLLRLIDEPALREKFGQRSRELVEPFSAENGAALFIRHLRLILSREHGAGSLEQESLQRGAGSMEHGDTEQSAKGEEHPIPNT